MDNLKFVGVILIFVFAFHLLISIWLLRYMNMRRDRIKKRIDQIEAKDWFEIADEQQKKSEKEKKNVTGLLWDVFGQIKIMKVLEQRLQNELKRANILVKPNEFIMIIFLFGFLGFVFGIFITNGSISRGGWLGLFTWTIPLMWLNNKMKARTRKFDEQLPDMVGMTANSLKAGYSIIQSLELLSKEMAPPLSEEIQKMLQEMRLGITTEQALINFNHRIDSKDLDLIITAMLIQRQVGGNLAEILDTIGQTIRERIKIQGEMKAMTAQGRMSMMIFLILPIGLGAFLTMSNPKYMMTLITHPLGWMMLVLAISGQLIGAIIIKKIIHIEV